jgi:predicted nucleic acid-binding protein
MIGQIFPLVAHSQKEQWKMTSKFVSALEKFGQEVLKIGSYVLFGLEGAQTVVEGTAGLGSPADNFLSEAIKIAKTIETTGAAASQVIGETALTGPQKLAALTVQIAQLLTQFSAGKAVKDVTLIASAAEQFAQGTVDYLKAFDAALVQVTTGPGGTTTIAASPAPAATSIAAEIPEAPVVAQAIAAGQAQANTLPED